MDYEMEPPGLGSPADARLSAHLGSLGSPTWLVAVGEAPPGHSLEQLPQHPLSSSKRWALSPGSGLGAWGWAPFLEGSLSPLPPRIEAGKAALGTGLAGARGKGAAESFWTRRVGSNEAGSDAGKEWEWAEGCRSRRRCWVLCQCCPAPSSLCHLLPAGKLQERLPVRAKVPGAASCHCQA